MRAGVRVPDPPLAPYAAARSFFSSPRKTIFSASSDNGRSSALASSHGARIQTPRSSSVVRITGMALGRIGLTTAFGAVEGGSLAEIPVVRSATRWLRLQG